MAALRFCFSLFVFLTVGVFNPAISQAGWVEATPDKTIIHVKCWELPDPTRTETIVRADMEVVNRFKETFAERFRDKYSERYKQHPELYGPHNWDQIEIQLHRASGITVEGVENTLLAIAGGVAPDVMFVNFRMSHNYIHEGFLYPLDKPEDPYLSAMTDEEINFRIHPKIEPVIHRKGPDGNKHIWAMPYGGALGKVVLYRKDLFDDAGVPYPDNHWTWDDFYTACKKISDPAEGIYGVHFSRGKHEAWWWMTFLWSAGGDALSYDENTDEWTAAFDSDEAVVALDFYNRICTEPWTDNAGNRRLGYAHRDADWGTTATKWERGEIGMLFAYIDEKVFQRINPDVTGIAPVPIGPTGIRGAELNSRMMGLFAGIEHPAVRDAAWEYIRFYDSKEAMKIRTQVMVEGGLGQFINPKYLSMFGYDDLIRLAPKGWKECFEIAIETGRPEPYGKNSNYIYDILTKPVQQAESLAFNGSLPLSGPIRQQELKKLLGEAVKEANEEMLGILTPQDRQIRRLTAGGVLTIMLTLFIFLLLKVGRYFSPPKASMEQQPVLKARVRVAFTALTLLGPALLTILLWKYIPLLRGTLIAFQDYRIMGGSEWIWLDNFGNVLWDREWWTSVLNSLRYSFLVIGLTFLPPVILAILLQEIPKGKMLFRMLFYLPAVITGLIVVLLWKSFYDPTENGALNAVVMHIPAIGYILTGLIFLYLAWTFARRLFTHAHPWIALSFLAAGLFLFYGCWKMAAPILSNPDFPIWKKLFMTQNEPFRWLIDQHTALLACVIPMVWAGMGPGCLIYLAALKGIPDDLYESADIDGATFVDKILFIVFPILRPLLIINFVGVFISAWLYATENILAMTGGASGTEVAGLHIFYKAFVYLKFGPATAMAWMLAFMLIGFTIYQLKILSRLEFKTTGDTD